MPAVDLRPPVKAARAGGSVYYLHDTHWTFRGALAGFNASVEADSHPDWRIDPSSVLGPPVVRKGGDMANILGLSDKLSEYTENLKLHYGKRVMLPEDDYIETSDKPGPRILIFGDSLTLDYFSPMLLQRAGSVVWIHHRYCGFDWRVIEKFRPDEVWWMPGERVLLCQASPTGLPEGPNGTVADKASAGLGRPAEAP